MKSYSIIIQFILVVLPAITFMDCSSSDDPASEPTEEEKQIQRLAKTWVLGSVEYGGDNISDRFDDFALTFTASKTYTATGSLGDFDYEPFKTSGTWVFKDGNLNLLARNDGVDMTAQVTDNTLTLTFNFTEANGRVAGLGEYKFDLIAD